MEEEEEIPAVAEAPVRQEEPEEGVPMHDLEEALNDHPRLRPPLEGFPNPRVRRPL